MSPCTVKWFVCSDKPTEIYSLLLPYSLFQLNVLYFPLFTSVVPDRQNSPFSVNALLSPKLTRGKQNSLNIGL